MIKQLLIYLAVILSLCNCNLLAQTSLTATPTYKHIVLPNATTIQLKLENVVNLYAASVTVSFDQNVVDYSGLVNGGMLTGQIFSNHTSNSLTIDLSNLDLTQFTGSGVLFSVTFNSIGVGTSPVSISEVKLRDYNNNPITANIVSGSINVTGPPVIVYIDHSFTSSNSGVHEWGFDAFTSIQEGISAVTSNGSVSINKDTYNEDLNFNKNLTLLTSGSGTAIIRSINLTGSSTLTVNNDITISNSISCTNGKVNTGTSVIDLSPTATVLESVGNYIIGYLRITESVGTAESSFGNVGLEINSGAGSVGNMTVTRVSGTAGKVVLGSVESISRKWIITSDLVPSPGRILTFHWVSDDDNGIGSTGRLYKSTNNGISWSSSGPVLPFTDQTFSSLPVTPVSSVWTISDGSNNLQNATGFVVNAKVFLQGPFNGTGMTTYLNSLGYLPLLQPYSIAPFSYPGNESVASNFFQNHRNIVDWILVEIRTDVSSSSIISRRAGFLLNDGSIVDINGTNPIEFKGIVDGNYYIVIRHRNHLAVMSAASAVLNPGSSVYDFTTSQSKAYNSSYNPMKQLAGGSFGLCAGDANSDGTVDAVDINVFWRPNNGTTYDYSKYADFNLDGTIDALDINLFWRMNNSKSSLVP